MILSKSSSLLSIVLSLLCSVVMSTASPVSQFDKHYTINLQCINKYMQLILKELTLLNVLVNLTVASIMEN